MACRTLLLKLEARGQIHLPPRRTASVNGLRALTRYMLFADWDALMDFMMAGLEIGPHAKKA